MKKNYNLAAQVKKKKSELLYCLTELVPNTKLFQQRIFGALDYSYSKKKKKMAKYNLSILET